MTRRSEAEIDQLLAPTAGEYAEQDRDAALAEADESDEAEGAHEVARSAVFSVRLPPTIYEAVRQAAARAHLTPSALIRCGSANESMTPTGAIWPLSWLPCAATSNACPDSHRPISPAPAGARDRFSATAGCRYPPGAL
jgi:hypothetical protein